MKEHKQYVRIHYSEFFSSLASAYADPDVGVFWGDESNFPSQTALQVHRRCAAQLTQRKHEVLSAQCFSAWEKQIACSFTASLLCMNTTRKKIHSLEADLLW